MSWVYESSLYIVKTSIYYVLTLFELMAKNDTVKFHRRGISVLAAGVLIASKGGAKLLCVISKMLLANQSMWLIDVI